MKRNASLDDVRAGQRRQQLARARAGQRPAGILVGDVAHGRPPPGRQLVGEPAHVPLAQIVGAHQPEGAVVPVEHGEVAAQPAGGRQHRREARPCPRRGCGRRAAGRASRARAGAGDLVAREGRAIEQAHALAGAAALLGHQREGVGAAQGGRLVERLALGREVERDLQAPQGTPLAALRGHGVVGAGRAQAAGRREAARWDRSARSGGGRTGRSCPRGSGGSTAKRP